MQQLGKYQLVRKLAVGGMAEVFLAKAAGPMGFEKTLVLKRILPNLAADRQFVRMFLAEAKLAASLNHPNIAQIFDFGQAEGAYFIAMEHVDGPNLRSVSRRSTERSIPLPVSLCAKIISYACEALAYAHEFVDPGTATHLSVIHRDVSPENILLSRNGAVKVVDFGIAKAAGQTHHTKSGILRGKISYMPPEQIQGKEIDHRADIFALGVVFYELTTGYKPFDARTDVTILQAILYEQMIPATARRPDIPEPITRILQRALAKDPDARYPTCRHFQADLERFIVSTGEPVGPYQLATLVAQLSGSTTAFTAATPPLGAVSRPTGPPRSGTPPPLPSVAARPKAASVPPVPAARKSPVAPVQELFQEYTAPSTTENADRRRRGAAIAGMIGAAAILAAVGLVLFRQGSQEQSAGAATDDERHAATSNSEPVDPNKAPGGAEAAPQAEVPAQVRVGATSNEALSARPTDPADPGGTRKSSHREAGTRLASRPRSARRSGSSEEGTQGTEQSQAPSFASFAVESVPPGQIFVNGKLVGSSPVHVKSLLAGEVHVEVHNTAAGFTKQEVFTVNAGDNGTKRIVVESAPVEFRIRPYATVFLDGKLLGQTPFPPVQVYEGKHSVKLVNADLNRQVAVDYVVKPGQANIFKYNLALAEN